MSAPEAEPLPITDLDMQTATIVGEERALHAADRGLKSRHPEAGKRTTSAENHILGVRAELGVARLLRLPWKANVGTIDGTDVGRDVEVRCRRLRDAGQIKTGGIRSGMLSLNRRDTSKGDKAFVLIHLYTDRPDVLWFIGWRIGCDVCHEQHWQHDPDMADGVFRLPHDRLKSLGQLRAFLEFRREQRHDDYLADIVRSAGGGEHRARSGGDTREGPRGGGSQSAHTSRRDASSLR